jgi:lipopolysaccharide transport system permease protein
MIETVYSSSPALRHPSRFLAAAGEDLRRVPGTAWALFRSNVRGRHRRALLGYVWLLVPATATTVIWVYVQSRRIISIAPTDLPYPVYVLAGTVLWQTFADALNAPLQQLNAGRALITRSRVSLEALILAGVYEVLLNSVVRLALLAAVLLAFRIPVGPGVLLVPFGIAALVVLGSALGVLAAPVGLLYDDVGRGITLATGFWFFLTPVLYRTPPRGIVRWNPVTPLLDTTRAWLTSGEASRGFVAVAVISAGLLVMAWLFQRLARPHVVARLG